MEQFLQGNVPFFKALAKWRLFGLCLDGDLPSKKLMIQSFLISSSYYYMHIHVHIILIIFTYIYALIVTNIILYKILVLLAK